MPDGKPLVRPWVANGCAWPQQFGHALQDPVNPFCDRFATKPEPPSPGRRAVVREAKEVERLRLAHPTLPSVHAREPPELHEAGLVRVEAEPGQPLPNVAEVLLRIPLVLEPDNEVVCIADDNRFAVRDVRALCLVEPQIDHIVQEHIRQNPEGETSVGSPRAARRVQDRHPVDSQAAWSSGNWS